MENEIFETLCASVPLWFNFLNCSTYAEDAVGFAEGIETVERVVTQSQKTERT
jgi:hypothetical protein